MKRRIFWSVFFTVFLRLQIYEAIAAIFWQFASYVFSFHYVYFCIPLCVFVFHFYFCIPFLFFVFPLLFLYSILFSYSIFFLYSTFHFLYSLFILCIIIFLIHFVGYLFVRGAQLLFVYF